MIPRINGKKKADGTILDLENQNGRTHNRFFVEFSVCNVSSKPVEIFAQIRLWRRSHIAGATKCRNNKRTIWKKKNRGKNKKGKLEEA